MLRVGKDTIFSIDVEATGKYWYRDQVFGIACCAYNDGEFQSEYIDIRQQPRYVEQAQEYANKAGIIVNHAIKYDTLISEKSIGLKLPPEKLDCTMVRASLIDEHLHEYSLDALCERYLGENKVDIYPELAEMFGGRPTRKAQIGNLHRAPVEMARRYAIKDPELAIRLWLWQQGEIKRQDLFEITAFERKFLPYVIELEKGGIRVDIDAAEQAMCSLDMVIKRKYQILRRLAGFEINYNSGPDVRRMFDAKLEDGVYRVNGVVVPTTDGGQPSFGKDTLELLNDERATLILELRSLTKTKDTFLGGHILGHAHEGKVYPSINQLKGDTGDGQAGTGTGRLSYTDPALQQIPARNKEVASIVRPVFLPDEGQKWSYGDLDQHEFRVFVHYTKAQALIDKYRVDPDLDIHTAVAELTGLPRNANKSGGPNAKQLNLGMVFNMGGAAIAKKMGMPTEFRRLQFRGSSADRIFEVPGPEAQEVIDQYHAMVPGVKQMASSASSIAQQRGYVKTIRGRHLRFPDKRFCYKASGLIYQGTSGDLNKENIMIAMDVLRGTGNRLLMSLHDEYSMSIDPRGLCEYLEEIKYQIENRPHIRVPLRIDFSEGRDSWWDATQAKKATGKGWSQSKSYIKNIDK